MQTTFKIILDKRHPKKDSTYPLRLRVYQRGKYVEQSVSISVLEKHWNELLQQVRKSNSNHKAYNVKLADIKAKAEKMILFNDKGIELYRNSNLKVLVNPSAALKDQAADIFEYAADVITTLNNTGRVGNALVYSCAVNKLRQFHGSGILPFTVVDYSYIQRFHSWMLVDGLKVNAVSNYLRTLRALFNKAIKEGVITPECYPFSRFRIKSEQTINRTLTLDELRLLFNLEIPKNSFAIHARNLFMLSYALIGINLGDLLTLTLANFQNGRVVFRRCKTHKVYSIRLHACAERIFQEYGFNDTDREAGYVLPFLVAGLCPTDLKKKTLQVIKNTNTHLTRLAKECGIGKPVTTYYARYSWANLARSLGYSKDMIAEGLGHSYGNKVTGIYLDHYSDESIDSMNTNVLDHTFNLAVV